MVICPFTPYGLAHGPKACQICHKLGPDFAEHISLKPLDGFTPFQVSWTCLDLSLCSGIVIYPFASYGLAHGPKTCQIRQHLGQTLRNPYLWNRWMDLYHLKLYVVQHHGYVTLTLGFQGQILKMLYLRNGRADWHGNKGMRVDRMWDPHCDFEMWPHPWPWPLIFSRSNFLKSRNSGMGCPIDMERKGCGSTECWTHVVTFNFDLTHYLDLEFSTSTFEIAVSQDWEGRSTSNERDMSR